MRTSIWVVISAIFMVFLQKNSAWLFNPYLTAEEISEGFDLTGQVGIVTGANTGIGQETARVFALRGMHVVLACRSEKKGLIAREELMASILESGNESREDLEKRVEVMVVDLASLASVKSFAEEFVKKGVPLHYMVLNAGLNSDERALTDDGLERVTGANWIAHFYMCHLLFERMKLTAETNSHVVRVVHVSSAAHTFVGMPGMYPEPIEEWIADWEWESRQYFALAAYAQSKLFQVAGANEMTKRWKEHGIISHSVHPGSIKTNMYYENQSWLSFILFSVPPFKYFVKTVEQGAATQVFAALSPEHTELATYFDACLPYTTAQEYWVKSHDPEIMMQVWDLSESAIERVGFSLSSL